MASCWVRPGWSFHVIRSRMRTSGASPCGDWPSWRIRHTRSIHGRASRSMLTRNVPRCEATAIAATRHALRTSSGRGDDHNKRRSGAGSRTYQPCCSHPRSRMSVAAARTNGAAAGSVDASRRSRVAVLMVNLSTDEFNRSRLCRVLRRLRPATATPMVTTSALRQYVNRLIAQFAAAFGLLGPRLQAGWIAFCSGPPRCGSGVTGSDRSASTNVDAGRQPVVCGGRGPRLARPHPPRQAGTRRGDRPGRSSRGREPCGHEKS
jgi:hypothetical protein